jgi:hypothetical protein
MGKRELVLIALFAVLGIVVYQFTAPPSPPGSDVSVGGLFQRMRRSVQGPRESATGELHRTVPVDGAIQTVRINVPRPSDLTITGADRNDIAIDIRTTARGFSQAEAKAAADGATVAQASAGDTMTLTSTWEDRRGPAGFVTQAAVTIAVPRRLHVSLLAHIGLLGVKDVASVDVASSRGETHVTGTIGDVRLQQIGSTIEIAGGASLKLTTRNGHGEISDITGNASIEATGARLRLTALSGALDIESRNSDITVEKIERVKPPLRFNGTGGALRIDGLRTEARIDGHNSDIDVRLAAAAPVTIYNVGAIAVTAPPDGYTLDAVATEGRITTDESNIVATPSDGPDARVNVKIRGGGPTLTLRATRGRIDVSGAAGK